MTPRDLHILRRFSRLVARGARLRTLTRLVARSEAKMSPMVQEFQQRMRMAMPRRAGT
jgi:hypothetical protein